MTKATLLIIADGHPQKNRQTTEEKGGRTRNHLKCEREKE
jgi:hypothetical protein